MSTVKGLFDKFEENISKRFENSDALIKSLQLKLNIGNKNLDEKKR